MAWAAEAATKTASAAAQITRATVPRLVALIFIIKDLSGGSGSKTPVGAFRLSLSVAFPVWVAFTLSLSSVLL